MTFQAARIKRSAGLFASIGLTMLATASASAGTVTLGDSGWEAHWAKSLDATVDIDFMKVVGNSIFIQKSAEFTQGSVNGVFPSVAITFRQIGASNITNIVIEDESLANSTGTAWTGFVMKLMNHGTVDFNLEQTAASGGTGPIGFSIDPFTTAVFNETNTKLKISGGVVTSGSSFYPGSGANDGQLWINVNSGEEGNYSLFTLKERPISTVVPGPSTLLALAGCIGLIGRKRRRLA